MILIVTEKLDPSSFIVTKWLRAMNKDWRRINEKKFFELNDYAISITKNGISHSVSQVIDFETIWYRRVPKSNVQNFQTETELTPEKLDLIYKIHNCITSEYNTIYSFINNKIINSKKVIGSYDIGNLNKLEVLSKACEIGLLIPDTYIVNNKRDLIRIIETNCNLEFIIKPVHNISSYEIENKFFTPYTRKINSNLLKNLDDNFHSTLIQQKIDLVYEVRIFYFCGKFYSMAIFSEQCKDSNLVDFRGSRNRRVPFSVPKEIENMLLELFEVYNFNYCSVDLLCGKDGKFYFLEINPIGQFGFVSHPCNYYIEKEIAEAL